MANNRILSEKLESLLQGIHEQYGNSLTDELIARLEYTIADFNEEIDSLMTDLKENASLKEKLMEDIKSGKTEEKTVDPTEYSAEEVKERAYFTFRKLLYDLAGPLTVCSVVYGFPYTSDIYFSNLKNLSICLSISLLFSSTLISTFQKSPSL